MAKRSSQTSRKKAPRRSTTRRNSDAKASALRESLLRDAQTLNFSFEEAAFDETLRLAEQEGLSCLEFAQRLLAKPARERREARIDRRIREARFLGQKTLEEFDWTFNSQVIDRVRIEELSVGDFACRGDNLMMIGPSGVGKTHLLEGMGRRWCAAGLRVRYVTSAELLADLAASLADRSLDKRLRYWSKFDVLILDEFAFDKIERMEHPQAPSLLYRVINARYSKCSTVVSSNVLAEDWPDYLSDPALASATLDRLVDNMITLNFHKGKSYRAHRGQTKNKR